MRRPTYYGPQSTWRGRLACRLRAIAFLGLFDWHRFFHVDSEIEHEHALVCTRCWQVVDRMPIIGPGCLANPARGSSPTLSISVPPKRVHSMQAFLEHGLELV